MNYFIQLIFNLLKQKKEKFVFTSYPDFSDNSFAFFYYLSKNYNFEAIWLIDSFKQIRYFKKIIKKRDIRTKVKFVQKKSIQGLYHYLTAGLVFTTHGLYRRLGRIYNHNVINLWHGMPLKKIEKLDLNNYTLPDTSNKYIVTSKFFKKQFIKIFDTSNDSILITGLPRNDFLLNGKINIRDLFEISQEDKVILWMPTFRDETKIQNDVFSKKYMLELNSFLEKNNSYCILKLHPKDKSDLSDIKNFQRIKILNDSHLKRKSILLYEILNSIDLLITDFSSVYIDFLLLNKPILFFSPDKDFYEKSRGFIFDNINELIPGDFLFTIEDLINSLEAFVAKNDIFYEKRYKIKSLLHDIDKDFSEKLYDQIIHEYKK